LQAQVSQSAHPDRIHFTGYRNDAPAIAAASDVFVLPSTEREGLPRAVIEAMAYGVAPIVTNVGGMPELVEKGVSGLVVPPKDAAALGAAIEQLFRNPKSTKQFGQAAQARIENHFHTSQTVRETSELYRSLVGSH
jgi:glycosyltransferase involved in cell wall biosynthesis